MGQCVGRGEIDVQGVNKPRFGDFFQRPIALARSACVIHQNVQTAPVLGQLFDDACQFSLVRNIASEG